MAFMITKLFTTHVAVYVQILSKLIVVVAEIDTETEKYIIKFVHVFGSVSVRFRFRRICESAHRV